MTTSKILIIATSANQLTSGDQTGIWLEELTTPYYAFVEGGADVTLASIAGGAIPVDTRSLAAPGDNEASVERYLEDAALQALVQNTPKFTDLDLQQFDAVFLPGGHGTMFDYPNSKELARLIETFDRSGKVVSAVCHGPAGLVSATKADGTPFVAGKRVAGFTESEEHAVGLEKEVPFLLETKLRELGAEVETAPDFQAFALRDGNLITGQNPASATDTAALVLDAVSSKAAA